MGGRSISASLWFAAAACSDVTVIQLRGPEVPSTARAMILVVEKESRAPEVWAFDTAALDPRLLGLPQEGDLVFYALMIECPLEAFGFEEGQLALEEGGRALPAASSIRVSRFTGGAQSAWEEGPLSPGLTDLRIRGVEVDPCALYTPELEAIDIHLPGTAGTNPSFGVPLDPDHVLVGMYDGRFYRVDDRTAVQLTELPASLPHHDAFARADGEIWLFGDDGAVVRGRPETGFSAVPPMAISSGFDQLEVDGARSGPIELYVYENNGLLQKFDGTTWTELDQSPGAGNHDVTFIAPGRAIAVIANPNRIIRVDSEGTHVGALPGGGEGPTATATSSLGVLIGTERGGIVIDRPGGMETIDDTPFVEPIASFLPFGPGFFVTASLGVGALYHPKAGFCHYDDYALQDVRPIVPVKDGFLLVSRAIALDEDIVLVFLRPKTKPPCAGGGK